MFEPPPRPRRRSRAQIISLALHAAIVYLLVRPPAALFVTPFAVQQGRGGTSMALVFANSTRLEASDPEEALPTRHDLAYLRPETKTVRLRRPDRANNKKTAAPQGEAARAGQVNGSVMLGYLTGRDVRPALPVTFPNPEVYPWQVPNGVEGNVVVEVTIDKTGAVIATKILQRLGYGIDEKVEAAVRTWRFRPATVDGAPIASQQDVVYRFPS